MKQIFYRVWKKCTAVLVSGAMIFCAGSLPVFSEGAEGNAADESENNAPQALSDTGGFTVTGGTLNTDYTYEKNVLTVKTAAPITISGSTTTERIEVDGGVNADITLSGVNIDVSAVPNTAAFKIADDSNGSVKVTLVGDNILKSGADCAGLQKNGNNGTLTIEGSGSLTVKGGDRSAGIGGGKSKNAVGIIINNGRITATGGSSAAYSADGNSTSGNLGGAGIGGGRNGSGTVTINGGEIIATGGSGGTGIGGGISGDGTVTITNGTVTATGSELIGFSGSGPAGIGGGGAGGSGTVTISGGTVKAIGGSGGKSSSDVTGGAGIGGGGYSENNTITITGGTVNAIGAIGGTHYTTGEILGMAGAGIGSGGGSDGTTTVKISGGVVTAIGGEGGSGTGNFLYGGAGIGLGGYSANRGGKFSFSTDNGNAFIMAVGGTGSSANGNGIDDNTSGGSGSSSLSGLIVNGENTVCNTIDNYTLNQDIEVIDGAKLTVAAGKTLTVNGALTVSGVLAIEDSGSFSVSGNIAVEEGGVLVLPSDISQENLDELNISGSGTVKIGDTKVYRVTINDEGSIVEVKYLISGEKISLSDYPEKDGYNVQWFTDDDFITAFDFETAIESHLTLYAKWTANSHTVSFDAQSGSSVEDKTINYGAAIGELPTSTREGYTFEGWFTEPEGKGVQISADTVITEDVTYYAKWTISPCTVSFDAQSGSSVEDKTINYGAAIGELPTSTREGYTFEGWFTEPEGKGVQISADTVITADITYYAKWTKNGDESGGSESDPVTPSEPQKPQDTQTDTEKPEDTPQPVIKGEDGKEGWEVIIEESEIAQEGEIIAVEMNGTTEVPEDVLSSIKGKDVTMTFDMGGGISWSVNGKEIRSLIGDIDFGVKMGSSGIFADVVNTVTGENYSVELTLSHEGEFGFTATLSVGLGSENAGYFASLFYYNKDSGNAEFIGESKIADDGVANLKFTHASEYIIVISEKSLGYDEGAEIAPADKDKEDKDNEDDNNKDGKDSNGNPGTGAGYSAVWFVIGGLMLVGGGVLAKVGKGGRRKISR